MKKALIACEFSGVVRDRFHSLKGWQAYSCDILPTERNKRRHFQCDVKSHIGREWDFIGAHPPCTFLANSGVRWLYNNDGSKNYERWVNLEKALDFFNMLKAYVSRTAGYIENPIPHKYAREGFKSVITGKWVEGMGRYNQVIRPYQFGHLESKRTCLWLYGLPKLKPTWNRKEEFDLLPKNKQQKIHYLPPSPDRWKIRSRTFPGIGDAMAKQWGGTL